ncbi:ATP-binding protein [Paractinoplanes hotanensis]|uniref:ATP-binding protein n=1 Tax=Paractinoplanes hotanensis TaxID=2906497 RepID=A0ABT0Y6B2_9ACTN|nr:ATP-binding protein [Actinoplanes hotanensis]MCM4081017.1 ATP-binding protein [Actinoplanes hotanensis]
MTGDAGMAVVEMAVHGRWSPHLGQQVSAALRMCLAGPPTPIVVALHDLDDPAGASLSFWLALWRQARLDTVPVHVAFSVASTTVLSRRLRYLRGPQPRVYSTVAEARAAFAARRYRTDRLQAWLEPRPASVEAARTLVTRACDDWDRPKLLQDACLIASELATNAVEHARTDFIVTVARSDTRLHLSIHDCVSRFPAASELRLADQPAELGERGRGLRLVHATAAVWGAVPTRDGKVVWAAVA